MLRPFRALLLDLDGTLVNSKAATEAGWREWAAGVGLEEHADEIARSCHGVPSVQHVAHWAPDLDPVAEAERIEAAQTASGETTPPYRGVPELLRLLPHDRIAIVTSATRPLATRRLAAAGVAAPAVLVCAGDAERGKPAPDPYLLGAARVGIDPDACVVVEDAPAGIAAGRAAGCQVVAVAHTHAAAELRDADEVFPGLRGALPALRASRQLPEVAAALEAVLAAHTPPVAAPTGDALFRPGVMDDVDVAVLYGMRDWTHVGDAVAEGGWAALGALSDAAFAAYAPAWMAWTLRNPDNPSYAAEALAAALADRPPLPAADAWLDAMAPWL